MNNSRDRQSLELKALRYMDAQVAGEIETMSALWDEACDDRELERVLSEIDEGLYSELAPAPNRISPTASHHDQPAGPWVVAGCVAGLVAATVVLSMPISAPHSGANRHVAVPSDAKDDLLTDSIGIASGVHGNGAASFSWPLHNSLSVGSPLDAIE